MTTILLSYFRHCVGINCYTAKTHIISLRLFSPSSYPTMTRLLYYFLSLVKKQDTDPKIKRFTWDVIIPSHHISFLISLFNYHLTFYIKVKKSTDHTRSPAIPSRVVFLSFKFGPYGDGEIKGSYGYHIQTRITIDFFFFVANRFPKIQL